MGLLLLLAGIVLIAVPGAEPWFSGQETVGLIAAIAGGVLVTINLVWSAFVAKRALKTFKEFDRRL